MGLIHKSRNHSQVQLMISRILQYAKKTKRVKSACNDIGDKKYN